MGAKLSKTEAAEKLFRDEKIHDLVNEEEERRMSTAFRRGMVQIREVETIKDLAGTLSRGRILGAPVLNADGARTGRFVDLLDVAYFLISYKDGVLEDGSGFKDEVWDRKLVELVGGARTKFETIASDASLETATYLMDAAHTHRIGLTDGEDGETTGLVTQFKIVEWIQRHMDILGERGKQPLGDLGLGRSKNVIQVSEDKPMSAAVKLMYENNIGGVVVTKSGSKEVHQSFTVRNLRGLNAENCQQLLRPLSEYYESRSGSHGTCTLATSFNACLDLMVGMHVHRLIAIDDEGGAIGVLTLTDIIKKFEQLYLEE